MTWLTQTSDGILLAVRARPGARQEAILGEQGGALKVAVPSPPEKGKANEDLVRVLARSLGLRRADIALIRGESSRDKVFRLRGIALEPLRARLDQILRETGQGEGAKEARHG